MEKQPELFNEFKFRETGRQFFLNKGLLPERALSVSVAYDKLILFALGFIIVVLIIFVIGFKCGARSMLGRTTAPAAMAARVPAPIAAAQAVVNPPARPLLPQAYAPGQQKAVKREAPKPYTIQVATYRSKEFAQEEVDKLRRKGFATNVVSSNSLYEVCAGEYSDMKEATLALNVLKKIYKDCVVRKR